MSNKIKQGDKVRVSKDAPKLYAKGWLHDWCNTDSIVKEVDNEDAVIAPITRANYELSIPTQYLVKVDAEAKETKIKLGDMVRVKGNLHEPFCLDADLHLEIPNIPPHAVSQKEWKVISVEDRRDCAGHIYTLRSGDSFIYNIPEDCVELIEPTEQTEAEKKPYEGISEETANEISDMLEAYAKALSGIADSFDWQRYEADLAKEVALKVANKFNAPHEAAEYAVSVAKAVVEGLKRK